MKIVVTCPKCGHRYDVPDRLAGRTVRCKDCATQWRVPVPTTIPGRAQAKRKRRKDESLADDLFDAIPDLLTPPDPAEIAAEEMRRDGRSRGTGGGAIPRWVFVLVILLSVVFLVGCWVIFGSAG